MLPPIVMLHGFATSSQRTWRDTGWADILADEGRQTHLIDLLGHGDAPKPADPQAYANLPEWTLERFPAEPAQVDALGFSMGARLTLTLAASHPQRFRRIVLTGVGNNVFEPDPEHGQMILQAIQGHPDPTNPVAQHFSDLASSPEADREALAAFLQQPRQPLTPADLQTITCPTLVILGDQDFAGPAEPLAEALPNSELLILPGVDHFATPKQFSCIDAAVNWLNQ